MTSISITLFIANKPIAPAVLGDKLLGESVVIALLDSYRIIGHISICDIPSEAQHLLSLSSDGTLAQTDDYSDYKLKDPITKSSTKSIQPNSQMKFDMNLALTALQWVRAITKLPLDAPNPDMGFQDHFDFADCLKDGIALCSLINILRPGSVAKINETKAPFKQRENLEMFLKGCEEYGLKSHDLFQVNDLYERKNLYMVVNCLFALGGLAQKKRFIGPVIGVKVAEQNRRSFSKDILNKSQSVIGLQAGNNKGATQAGMTPYGAPRQIMPDTR
ncbi:unnamed protein product [Oppiella nova]|uniref:Calponin-homology (CH) domain-containing protein n=1 Tax=Oppiella nova TaxID=334625 RepID=A0A7R9LTU2_9ACAR|nr:unnamed protein product [Oppiella nova]CAG2166920.1 unnamed protein product [Oppiella nova]